MTMKTTMQARTTPASGHAASGRSSRVTGLDLVACAGGVLCGTVLWALIGQAPFVGAGVGTAAAAAALTCAVLAAAVMMRSLVASWWDKTVAMAPWFITVIR